jgi:exopolyphosphatase/guanosine-5'-triphosphate,3'-diphosphate pyrophosphatase
MTTARAIIAARKGKPMEKSDPILTIGELRELLRYVGRCNLEDRKRIPEMPAGRADVMPTALATIIAVAEVGGVDAYRNSLYNLRWGVADELLSAN